MTPSTITIGPETYRVVGTPDHWKLVPGSAPGPRPSTEPRRLVIGVNSVFDFETGEPLLPGVEGLDIDIVSRHLRVGAPPDPRPGDSEARRREIEAITTARVNTVLDQIQTLVRSPPNGPMMISSDGADWLWKSVIAQVAAALPDDVHFENFVRPASRFLRTTGFSSETLAASPQHRRTWTNRGTWPVRGTYDGAPLSNFGGNLVEGDDLDPVQLGGASLSYGILSSAKHDARLYAQWLGSRVDLTRVWCIEMWTALDLGEPLSPWLRSGEFWDLTRHSPEWWDRLETFLSECQRLGVAVIVTAFDRAGMRNKPERGRWRFHPFHPENGLGPKMPGPEPPRGGYPRGFYETSGPFWDRVQAPYIQRLARVLRNYPNAILEIMNEARPDPASGIDAGMVTSWHRAVIETARGA